MKSLYFMGGCPPFRPLATILLYYIYGNMSIVNLHILTGIYLLNIDIYGIIYCVYNIC